MDHPGSQRRGLDGDRLAPYRGRAGLSKENDEGWVASISPAIQSYRPTNQMSIYSYSIVRMTHTSAGRVSVYSYTIVRITRADTVSSRGGFAASTEELLRRGYATFECGMRSPTHSAFRIPHSKAGHGVMDLLPLSS